MSINMVNQKKIFVPDTNGFLHDCTCIYQFRERDTILPITILKEPDKFKKGNGQINFQARKMDFFMTDQLLKGEGIKIVSTGDVLPFDLPYLDLKSNGLSYLTE
jgi:predicted ribonuclease YlaK